MLPSQADTRLLTATIIPMGILTIINIRTDTLTKRLIHTGMNMNTITRMRRTDRCR